MGYLGPIWAQNEVCHFFHFVFSYFTDYAWCDSWNWYLTSSGDLMAKKLFPASTSELIQANYDCASNLTVILPC